MSVLHRLIFRLRIGANPANVLRTLAWRLSGAHIGWRTFIPARCSANWPHQLSIGRNCVLETDIQFKYAAPYRRGHSPAIAINDGTFLGRGTEFNCVDHIEIGTNCLIGSGCKFIDADHGKARGELMNRQPGISSPIFLEADVWLGVNVIVLKGVTIGTGAIVAAGAVVNRSVPAGQIWGGIPARKIGERS